MEGVREGKMEGERERNMEGGREFKFKMFTILETEIL